MKVKVKKAKALKKYHIFLNEWELKQLCVVLNEKTEKLMAENDLDSEIHGLKLNLILKKLTAEFQK